MSKQRFKIISDSVRDHIIRQVRAAEWGKVVTIEDPTRSLEANARFHAMLTDISRQAQYMGKPRSVEFWKALFVSGWMVATDQNPEMVPGLEGEYLLLRESTATMKGKRLSACMEYVTAWAAMNDIKFSASEWEVESCF